MKIITYAGGQLVPTAQTFIELNTKLFNVMINARNVAIIFVGKVL